MPLISLPTYKPSFLLKSGHLSTLYPYLLRKNVLPAYIRQRWDTIDGDFIDLDFLESASRDKIMILNHGLEGSSSSQYIMGMANYYNKMGWNICAINNRSCSGQLNRNLGFYHSGFTEDLKLLVPKLASEYKEVHLVGFSLGGNQILKYLGQEHQIIPSNVKSAVAISVPIDLEASAIALKKWGNKLYTYNFLSSLKQKVQEKAKLYPSNIDLSHLPKLKELMDFDEYYTSSLQGFKDAKDYYNQSSSKQFLQHIKIPTLLINAFNDPFLGLSCFPYEEAKASSNFYFHASKYGGHAGFPQFRKGPYWTELMVNEWVNNRLPSAKT